MREARLRWYGHVTIRNVEYVGRRVLNIDVPGRRRRGMPRKSWKDPITKDMKVVGAREEDPLDRNR